MLAPPFDVVDAGRMAVMENVDRSVEKAKALGGGLTMGPQDLAEVGRFAMPRDPQGAAFYVFQPTGPMAGDGSRP